MPVDDELTRKLLLGLIGQEHMDSLDLDKPPRDLGKTTTPKTHDVESSDAFKSHIDLNYTDKSAKSNNEGDLQAVKISTKKRKRRIKNDDILHEPDTLKVHYDLSHHSLHNSSSHSHRSSSRRGSLQPTIRDIQNLSAREGMGSSPAHSHRSSFYRE